MCTDTHKHTHTQTASPVALLLRQLPLQHRDGLHGPSQQYAVVHHLVHPHLAGDVSRTVSERQRGQRVLSVGRDGGQRRDDRREAVTAQ